MLADLRYALRVFAKSPAFTLVAVVTMALGIGANTAVFSLINAVMLRSLPYGDAAHLVYFFTPNPRFKAPIPRELPPFYGDFYDVQRRNHSFSILAGFEQTTVALSVPGAAPDRTDAARVTGNFFETLRVQPQLGRSISAEDDQPGHGRVVWISDALWRTKFGASRGVLGQTLLVNRQPYTILGVMSPDFRYPREREVPFGNAVAGTDVWIPLALTPRDKASRDDGDATAIGRLRPGVSIEQAQTELAAIMASDDSLHRPEMRGWTAMVEPLSEAVVGGVRGLMWLLFGAVSLVLLIASSNVASLLMARATARAHEMGVRSALGAARRRLIRQMLTESMLLAVGGGTLGVALAFALVRMALRLNPGDIPRLEETTVDARVLLFSLIVSVLTGLLFGLLPAFSASKVSLTTILKQGGARGIAGTSNRLRHGLIVAELALSMILLAGAGLLIRSFVKLQSTDPGFSPSTLTMTVFLDDRYSKIEKRSAFYRDLMEETAALPGVRAVGAGEIPLDHNESLTFIEVEGDASEKGKATDIRQATAHYFEAMSIHLLEGRTFSDVEEKAGAPVAIVNQAFARHYFPRESAIRKHLRAGWVASNPSSAPWLTIIGVIADMKYSALDQVSRPEVWRPLAPQLDVKLAISANGSPERLIPAIRGVLRAMDPQLNLTDVETMRQRITGSESRRRFQTLLLAIFAGVALFLALVGLYALLAYSVRQRTPELGIRMTLGASRGQILTMILKQGLLLSLAGILVGLAGAFAVTRLISSWLYGVSAADPITFLGAPLFLLLAAIAACLIPALRATRIDPAVALRYE